MAGGGACGEAAGIDVAGPGEDETVLTIRRGACVVFQKSWVGERSSGHVGGCRDRSGDS
jgi:hypothetical protein